MVPLGVALLFEWGWFGLVFSIVGPFLLIGIYATPTILQYYTGVRPRERQLAKLESERASAVFEIDGFREQKKAFKSECDAHKENICNMILNLPE